MTKSFEVGDRVIHKLDPEARVQTVLQVFPWLGRRKVVTEDFKDWESYFLTTEEQ